MKSRAPETQAATQWIQMWQEIFRMWMGYVSPFMPGSPNMGPFAPGAAFPYGPHASRSASSELEIELETSQRVSVSLHLTEHASSHGLRAQLHREQGEGKLAVEFDPENIRIAVPAHQPAGTYSGVVRDDAGQQCGMLTIVVFGGERSGD